MFCISLASTHPCYSLGNIVQTSEYFINKRLSKYLLYCILMLCMPSGIALMGSIVENAGWNCITPSPVLDKTRLIVIGTSQRWAGGFGYEWPPLLCVREGFGGMVSLSCYDS